MGFTGRTAEERNLKFRKGKIEYFIKKAKTAIQEMNDGRSHKVEIYSTDFYGNNRFITAPYNTITLMIDGRRELGGKIESGITKKVLEFEWYGTEDGHPRTAEKVEETEIG